jgi:hypothetical protein
LEPLNLNGLYVCTINPNGLYNGLYGRFYVCTRLPTVCITILRKVCAQWACRPHVSAWLVHQGPGTRPRPGQGPGAQDQGQKERETARTKKTARERERGRERKNERERERGQAQRIYAERDDV